MILCFGWGFVMTRCLVYFMEPCEPLNNVTDWLLRLAASSPITLSLKKFNYMSSFELNSIE